MNTLLSNSKDTLARLVIKSTENTLINLYSRWLDEKEYEDFSDYENIMRETVTAIEGTTFLKGTQRPFGFQFQTPDGIYHYSIRTQGNKLFLKVKFFPPQHNINQFLSRSDKSSDLKAKSHNRKKR